MSMRILYEDARIVVCVKPSGILSTDESGGMPELLRQQLQAPCIRTVHRLDRPVGGVMVFARSKMAASILSKQMRDGQFHKQYLAVIHGTPPPNGEFSDLLLRDAATHRTLVTDTPSKDTRPAQLTYQLLQTANDCSLVKIQLQTGRTHQIRAQFSAHGFPLVGDFKYGAPAEDCCPVALFSASISFLHPQTMEPMAFSAMPQAVYPWTFFQAFGDTLCQDEPKAAQT